MISKISVNFGFLLDCSRGSLRSTHSQNHGSFSVLSRRFRVGGLTRGFVTKHPVCLRLDFACLANEMNVAAKKMKSYQYIGYVPEKCTCRYCKKVYEDPVAFPCGHVYCRLCAIRCHRSIGRCRFCNRKFPKYTIKKCMCMRMSKEVNLVSIQVRPMSANGWMLSRFRAWKDAAHGGENCAIFGRTNARIRQHCMMMQYCKILYMRMSGVQ